MTNKRSVNKSWYRGEHCNFNPSKKAMLRKDAFDAFIVSGWKPARPFIDKKTSIIAFGSCFAVEITKFLSEKGFSIASSEAHGTIDFRAGVNNTFAIRQLFEWVYENKNFLEETWHDENKEIIARNEKIRKHSLKTFKKADVFILTLGLSEVWYNKKTNAVFWRAIPQGQFDSEIHAFKVSTFKENKENIQYIFDTIKKIKPNAKVIFTISPVPLVATFRPASCISANNVSKSILRAAVDEFYRENNGDKRKDLFYWPSYEIVEKLYNDPYKPDNRHIKKDCVNFIMNKFKKYYIKKGA